MILGEDLKPDERPRCFWSGLCRELAEQREELAKLRQEIGEAVAPAGGRHGGATVSVKVRGREYDLGVDQAAAAGEWSGVAVLRRESGGGFTLIGAFHGEAGEVLASLVRALEEARQQLGQAAGLIPVAGPLPHRIRMLEQDHARTFDKIEARLNALLRERVAYLRALVQEDAEIIERVTGRVILLRDETTTELAEAIKTLAGGGS